MITVKQCSPQADPAMLKQLLEVDTATIGHFRHWGFVDPALRPVIHGRRVAGTAVTVAVPAIDSSLIHYVMGMVRPGDFLIVDRLGDRKHACMGGVVALAAKVAGVVGIAIDGFACDFDEIRQHDLPLWCRGETSLTAKFLAIGGAINVPVSCGGAAVCPGDVVLADNGGVVIIPRDEVPDTIATALPMQKREPSRLDRIRAGERLGVINGSTAKVDAAIVAQEEQRKNRS